MVKNWIKMVIFWCGDYYKRESMFVTYKYIGVSQIFSESYDIQQNCWFYDFLGYFRSKISE